MHTKQSHLRFQISSKLPKLLGRDSVSTETQALFELVKNSFDADGSQVTISFKNISSFNIVKKALDKRYKELLTKLKTENPDLPINKLDELAKQDPYYLKQEEYAKKIAEETTIIIEDNGKGMTMNQLQNKWMKIGTSKSPDEIITEKKRRVVGEKGVGRFAVERLSHRTRIISKPKNEKKEIMVEMNWDEFEDSRKNVDQIRIPIKFSDKKTSEHGFKIELIHLRDEWTSTKIEKLLEGLSLLVLPQEIDSNFPFNIKVQYKKKGKTEIVNVEGGLLKKAPYHFVAELTSESTIKFTEFQYMKEQIIPNIRGLEYPKLVKEFPFVKGDEKETSVALCGPAKFTFYGFPMDPPGRDLGWTKFYGEHLVAKIQSDSDRFGGIRIYRDGFRVRPYGEPGHDWLSLEEDARRHAGRLGSRSVIGWVSVSIDKNPKILDTTTREKIIENEAFEDLVKFVQDALDVYYRFTEERRRKIVKKEDQKKIPTYIKKLRDGVVDNAAIPTLEKKNLLSTLDKIQSHFVIEEERVQIEKESLMDEKNAYRNMASVGITTGVVSHEIRDYLRAILLHTGVLKREANKETLDQKQLVKSLTYIEPSASNLLNYMELIGGFTAAMSSRKKEFRQKRNLNLHNEFRLIITNLKGILGRWEIQVENKVPHNFPRLRMFQADLQSILLNLLSNSIKSLKQLTGERHELSSSKKNIIRLSARLIKNEVIITFSDNGKGIAPMDRKFVFDLFWTRTATRETVKSGSGLGLPIIKEIVKDYNGDIEIEDKAEFEPGVTFKITIPQSEIIKND